MTIITVQKSRCRCRDGLLLAALLAGMALLASGRSMPEPVKPPTQITTWRRTQDGWEQPRWLTAKQPPRSVPPHPLCVAVLTLLLVAMGLVGYTPHVSQTTAVPAPHFKAAFVLSDAAAREKSG